MQGPPVIDLTANEATVLRQIDYGCREWGFFQVVNHNVDKKVIEAFDQAAVKFFALPLADKKAVERTEDNARGYFDAELTKRTLDHKEGFDYGGYGDHAKDIDGVNRFPTETMPEFEKAMMDYYDAVEHLAYRLTELVALSLGLDRKAFVQDLTPNTSFLRVNHYPPAVNKKVVGDDWGIREPKAEQDGVLGINKHTDAGLLTVLRQRNGDPPSLQVLSQRTNKFVTIHPATDGFIINVGDCLQVWSNDRYKSALHRVLANNVKPRYSAPYFLNPHYDAVVRNKLNEPPVYAPYRWGYFRMKRFEGDFADYGNDDIQISDFKLKTYNSSL